MAEQYTATFRSRLNTLPLELKCAIGEIPLQKGMRPTSRKEKIISLLNEYNIDYIEIGTGTNRFIIKYDGYAIKIALDNEGIADNIQEFAICESLMPHVAYCYEMSKGGHLLVAAYCPAFTSMPEMWSHNATIRNILTEWSRRFLLGDVGLSRNNYANWGLAPGGRPVCIDYAYVFPASMDLFKCIKCNSRSIEIIGSEFTTYRCTNCKKEYEYTDIRARISRETRFKLFNNVKGIKMSQEYEVHPVDPKYIKVDNNPDLPDVYETAMTTNDHLNGNETFNWY